MPHKIVEDGDVVDGVGIGPVPYPFGQEFTEDVVTLNNRVNGWRSIQEDF